MSNKNEDRVFSLNESQSDLVVGIIFLVFSLALLFAIIPTQIADTGSDFPSPRFFSRACGVLMLILSICQLFEGYRKRGKPQNDSERVVFSHRGLLTATAALGILIIGVVLLSVLPYVPVTIVMLFALMMLFGQRSKLILVCVSVILPVVVYMFFTYGLKLVLP